MDLYWNRKPVSCPLLACADFPIPHDASTAGPTVLGITKEECLLQVLPICLCINGDKHYDILN